MPRCPFTSSDRALRETPSAFALSVTLNPKGSVQGLKIPLKSQTGPKTFAKRG
jgi:hypothetical protein